MRDALNLVIVQFAIVITVAALAGGVLGWVIGRGRRRRSLAVNETGDQQTAAPAAGVADNQAEDQGTDLRVRMVAPMQSPEHEVVPVPLAPVEPSGDAIEATLTDAREVPHEGIESMAVGTAEASYESAESALAGGSELSPEVSYESAESALMGASELSSEVSYEVIESALMGGSELSPETIEPTGIATRSEFTDLGATHLLPDSGDAVVPQSDAGLAPEVQNLWPSLPAEANTPVIAPATYGIDEPGVSAVRLGAEDDRSTDELLGPDSLAEYNNEFDTHVDLNSHFTGTGELFEATAVVGSGPEGLGGDVPDSVLDFDGGETPDSDTLAPYTSGKVASATWPSPLDMAADAQSEADPATNVEHMTNTDAQVDPATWPSPIDTGSMQPVVRFPTANAVAEFDEARSQDLFPSTTPDQESDDRFGHLSKAGISEPEQDGPFASEPFAAPVDDVATVAVDPGGVPEPEPDPGAFESGSDTFTATSEKPFDATASVADKHFDESEGATPADHQSVTEEGLAPSEMPTIEPGNEISGPETSAAIEADDPPVDFLTGDLGSEAHETDSPVTGSAGERLNDPGAEASVLAGSGEIASGLAAPAAVVAAGLVAAASADQPINAEASSDGIPGVGMEDTEAATEQAGDPDRLEMENSEIIPAVTDTADASDERDGQGAEISVEEALDESVEAVGVADAEVVEPGLASDETEPQTELNSTKATVKRLVTYEQLYDEWGTETIAAVRDPEQSADSDIGHLRAQVAALKEQIVQKDVEMMRLETGATAAWDTTVPSLQQTITELREDNGRLATALREARNNLESMALELDRMQKPRGPLLPPEQSN
ncbi:hypothetical protein HMPREF1531_00308 [Propionibacterium sp. oral taxon 192 str. F0372]|uniref:hypothetical protein n=1 Tax=Propionibacterium sp. oral taxon 192 TaxID=671222 RepID=UPI0003529D88|nr:hypothetical protein [Propionibacterium sp. oral taxon 192]EPH07251.1 hypothetical protein HMPREF1531_00308 [Propionibacterium sp. oral taxon 192 str. F0372]